MKPFESIHSTVSTSLQGKIIVLAVTGSIAAVKCVELARELIRHGAMVIPVMTSSACEILHPNALEYATGQKPITHISAQMEYLDLFGKNGKADLLLICPSTADCISKIAYGFADDIISLMAMNSFGSNKSVLIVPAMHQSMWDNKIVEENIGKLKKLHVNFLHPLTEEGIAKLPEKEEIVLECERLLSGFVLKNKKIVIASGRTEEDIDDIRVLTNRSSGQMGHELALEAYRLGATVVLIHSNLLPFHNIRQVYIRTADEMQRALMKECSVAHYLFMPAAVGDFDVKVVNRQKGKISSRIKTILELHPRPKIIARVRKKFSKLFIIGFKACANNSEIERVCLEKLKNNRLQAIVGTIGKDLMGADKGTVWLFHNKKCTQITGSKAEIAHSIFNHILN